MHHTTSHCTTSHCCITLYYTTIHHTALHHTAVLHYTTIHHTALHHTTVLHYTTPKYITLCCTTRHHNTPHCTTPYYAALNYTALHYSVQVDCIENHTKWIFSFLVFFSFKLPSSSSTPVSSDSESDQELKVGNTALSIEVWVSWNQLQFSTLEKWLLLRVFSCFKTTGRWQGQTSLQYDKCNFFFTVLALTC